MAPMDPRHRIAYDAAFYTLAIIFLLLRFAQRLTPTSIRRIRENPSIPALLADFFMLLALAFTTTAIGLDIWLQMRTIYLSSDLKLFGQLIKLYPVGMKIMFANQIFWALLMWSVKAALMALYYDIAKHVTERVKRLMHFTCVVLFFTLSAVVAVFLGWCKPLSTNWTLGEKMCTAQANVFPVAFTSALHMLTDIMVLGIPLLILRTLHLQRAQVIAVYFIFGIGFLAFSVSLVSLVLQIQVVGINHNSPSYLSEIEIKTERVYLAAVAECSIAMVGACLPSLRVFLRMVFKSKDGSGKKNPGGQPRARKAEKAVSPGGSNSSGAPLMIRPGGGFAGYGSDICNSRSGSPAPAMVGFNQSPLSIRENLKKPLLAIANPVFGRGSHGILPQNQVAAAAAATDGKDETVGKYTAGRKRSPSVDSLIIDPLDAHLHQPQPLQGASEIAYSQHQLEQKNTGFEQASNTGIGVTTEYTVEHTMASNEPVEQPPQKAPTYPYGHQRSWSGPGAPTPIPLSYSPDHWR